MLIPLKSWNIFGPRGPIDFVFLVFWFDVCGIQGLHFTTDKFSFHCNFAKPGKNILKPMKFLFSYSEKITKSQKSKSKLPLSTKNKLIHNK